MTLKVSLLLLPREPCPTCGGCNNVLTVAISLSADYRVEKKYRMCLPCLIDRGGASASLSLRFGDLYKNISSAQKRRILKTSKSREEDAAREVGGHRVPQSGAGVAKGDARNEEWMVEDKFTHRSSFRLSKPIIDKSFDQSAATGRKPVIRVGLPGLTDLAILRWSDLAPLIKAT